MGANRLNLYPGTLTLDEFKEVTWGDHPDFDLIEDGQWVSGGKYEYCTQVVKELATGKFYQYDLSRSGSYYTDYYYSHEDYLPEIYEVQKVTKTITIDEWVPV